MIFFNAYSNDLGTGKFDGDEIGCELYDPTSIYVSSISRIVCKLSAGVGDSIKPKIIITGYKEIAGKSKLRLLLSNLQSLKATDTTGIISIGVNLVFHSEKVEAYLYEPTLIIPV